MTYSPDILEESYRGAKSNGESPGVDGVTFSDIESKGVAEYLMELQAELKTEQHRSKPVL